MKYVDFKIVFFFILLFFISYKNIYPDTNLGFIYKSTTYNNTYRKHILGPVYNHYRDENLQKTKILFYSHYEFEKRNRTVHNFLYPIFRYMNDDDRTGFFITPLFAYRSETFQRKDSFQKSYNYMLFPILFYGKDRHDNYSYGLFPVYGNLRRVLGKDEFNFIMFPIYLRTIYNNEDIRHVLYPILAFSESETLSLRRFFPFYGRMKRPDIYERKFIMFPFYQEKRIYHQNSEYVSRVFFPFYGIENYPNARYKSYLYPIFRYKENDLINNFSLLPLIIHETNERRKRRFYSILYGKTTDFENETVNGYFLLPLGYFQKGEMTRYSYNNYYFLPLLRYYSTVHKNNDKFSRFQLFPLLKTSRHKDLKRITLPSLDIFLNRSHIEEEYSRWWELLRIEHSQTRFRFDFLWSFIEYENNSKKKKKIYGLNPFFNVKYSEKKREINFLFNLITFEKEHN